MAPPSSRPSDRPMPKPANTRTMLMRRWSHSSPLASSSPNTLNTAAGGGSTCSGTQPHTADSCHSASTASGKGQAQSERPAQAHEALFLKIETRRAGTFGSGSNGCVGLESPVAFSAGIAIFCMSFRVEEVLTPRAGRATSITTKGNVKDVCYKNIWLILICNDKDVCGMSSGADVMSGARRRHKKTRRALGAGGLQRAVFTGPVPPT